MKKIAYIVPAFFVFFMALIVYSAEWKADFKGHPIAFVSGHGGHVAVIDLQKRRLIKRVVATDSGGELEGPVAGLILDKEHPEAGGGTHGAAISPDGRTLYVGTLNGNMIEVNLENGEAADPIPVGKKFCDALWGPDDLVWLEDMADGALYAYDPKVKKAADRIEVGNKSTCGLQWSKDGKTAWATDMVTGTVSVIDWTTKKVIGRIENVGTFIHQAQLTPDGTELWVTAPNEFTPKLEPRSIAPGGEKDSEVVIIDVKTNKIKDKITMPGRFYAHDVEFSPDGKYAIIAARTYGPDSVLLIYDAKSRKKLESPISACETCHSMMDVEVTLDQGAALLCGVTVDWAGKTPFAKKRVKAKKAAAAGYKE